MRPTSPGPCSSFQTSGGLNPPPVLLDLPTAGRTAGVRHPKLKRIEAGLFNVKSQPDRLSGQGGDGGTPIPGHGLPESVFTKGITILPRVASNGVPSLVQDLHQETTVPGIGVDRKFISGEGEAPGGQASTRLAGLDRYEPIQPQLRQSDAVGKSVDPRRKDFIVIVTGAMVVDPDFRRRGRRDPARSRLRPNRNRRGDWRVAGTRPDFRRAPKFVRPGWRSTAPRPGSSRGRS